MSSNIDQLVQITKETIVLSAQEILGEGAEPVIQRIRNAPNTPAGLREAVESCKNITKSEIPGEGGDAIDVVCEALLRDMDDAVRANANKNSSPERDALKARIIQAKLIAATSSLLGAKAAGLVNLLQDAATNRASIREAYEACEELANQTLPAGLAASFKDRCGRILQQL
jgi:hypothetical protein